MKVAITGGIGSGKSYVCRQLRSFGIEVYDCDAAAKRLMRNNAQLQADLIRLVGEGVYLDGILQKAVLANYLLADEAHKQAVNDVVHPAVASDFEQSGIDWLESAILYESGFVNRTHFDKVVCVTAPLEMRVQRVMARDGIDRQKTLEWIHAQMPQDQVVALSDYEIVNDGFHDIDEQIAKILKQMEQV